jgi:arylsulfatase A-like enzyme
MVPSFNCIKKFESKTILVFFIFIFLWFFSFLSSKYMNLQHSSRCIGCNIIFVSIDSLRADHLSSYGYFRNTSPNIDRFAEKAIIFKNAFSQSYWTLPSHASIFISKYPSAHDVKNSSQKLSSAEITLAEILKKNGYKTLAFTGDGYVSSVFGFSQGFDIFVEDDFTLANNIQKALEWIKINKDVKFFIFLHGYELHSLLLIPRNFLTIYADPQYKGIGKTFNLDEVGYLSKSLNESDVDYITACYDGGINYIDQLVGILLDELSKLQLEKNTIIVITSDHGQALMEHGYILKHVDLYDEIIHIPLIIKSPRISFKKIIENQVQSIDIMPTILDLVGISIPATVQGRSLLPLINEPENTSFPVYSEKEDAVSIRINEFKFIWRDSGRHELYNLANDPKEKINLIDRYPNLGKILEREINRFLEMNKKKALNTTISEEEFRKIESRLKQLGYI